MTFDTSIGIEIEVNRFSRELRNAMDASLWKTGDEHCGTELRSVPRSGPAQIREIVKSLAKMHSADPHGACGFNNAGVHIHIDFIPTPNQTNPRKETDLEKIDTTTPEVWMCQYCNEEHEEPKPNPYGTAFYFRDRAGGTYKTVQDYIRAWKPKKPEPVDVYEDGQSYPDILESVKRFMIVSKRFAHVLFAVQKPERRFNKYCHTIEYWDENLIANAASIQQLCDHHNLAHGNRRLMVNPLSFRKYGTIEVRMIAATLDANELWAQIFLFGKLARLAKNKKIAIPEPTGNVALDFVTLMNAAGIYGRVRSYLSALIALRKATTLPTRCFICQNEQTSEDVVDFGLSRPVCKRCVETYSMCDFCGQKFHRNSSHISKFKDHNGLTREICDYCVPKKQNLLLQEKNNKGRFIIGTFVGNGLDEKGVPLDRRM